MTKCRNRYLWFLGVALVVLLISLACAAAEDTPTAVPPAPPTTPVAPTAVPAPTPTLVPGAPTPVPVLPTPTRILPTPTPAAIDKPLYGGTLRYVGEVVPTNFDPNSGIGVRGRYINHAIYDKLVRYSPTLEIIPGLASSWDFSSDGKSITFHLQEGAKFHDGTDMDAQAVKWNLDHQMDPDTFSRNRKELVDIESVEVVDKSTVTIHLKKPTRPLMASLGDRGGMFISPTAFQKLGADYGANPVGSGPFKFKKWVIESYVTLERNENYWEEGIPYLDQVILQNVKDKQIQLAMLRTGEADIMEQVRGEDIPIIESNPNLRIVPHESGRFYAVQLAVDTPPWDNLALRQAVGYALDRETILKVYYADLGRVAYTPVGTGWAHDPSIKVYSYDPEKAKEKMVEAGYPNGITVDGHCKSDAANIQLCEITQAQLAEVGINLNIIPVLAADQPRLCRERIQLIRWTSWSPRADPGVKLNILFHSGASQSTGVHGYSNPEVDRLIEEAAGMYDISKVKPIYDKVQRIVAEDGPYMYTIWKNEVVAINKRVQGFQWIPDLMLRFRPIWLK